ncbi:MAG TPA: DUF1328 domain-containing protein [Alphaproteobacteria bacterium]|nr:DUF1328 domain-containing protein [Alphaproteobacteria bacterium]
MWDTSSFVMSIVAGLIGLTGLFLASRATDIGFYIFGLSLAAFGIVYVFTTIKRLYDSNRG